MQRRGFPPAIPRRFWDCHSGERRLFLSFCSAPETALCAGAEHAIAAAVRNAASPCHSEERSDEESAPRQRRRCGMTARHIAARRSGHAFDYAALRLNPRDRNPTDVILRFHLTMPVWNAKIQVAHKRPWLSWIERLATDQKVGGSNPSGRAITLGQNRCRAEKPSVYAA